jgi:hypothetical protein
MLTNTTVDQSYVPAHLAIEAMRDNGYKNTAFAVAELIDNSIQAEASYVQLLCAERDIYLTARKSTKLDQLAVLDNGIGMSPDILRMSLQFGNGTRLNRNQRTGIGRFGMGLPASSISQCTKVEVWSWQYGIENAHYVFLDIAKIKERQTHEIPQAERKAIPEIWRKKGTAFGASGTLVVWSNLDRMMWNKGQTLVKHSERLIGRMYRKFLYKDQLKIEFSIFNVDNIHEASWQRLAFPNDPMYLMQQTSCPEPYNNESMFDPYGGPENYERKFNIRYNDENHEIFVRLALAKDDARDESNGNPGSKPHGKHAKENVGISIVRAGRELELDQSLVSQHDSRERWWGVEVEFSPALDELMGVTNNKQTARNFSDILNIVDDVTKMQHEGQSILDIMEELKEEGDPRAPLIEVCDYINKQLSQIRKALKNQTSGSRTSQRHQNHKVEQKATDKTEVRKQMGFVGESDQQEHNPPEQRKAEMKEGLVQKGVDDQSAETAADYTILNKLKYSFLETPFEGDAFFTVQSCGGAISILLNTNHPAYECLLETLDEENGEISNTALKERLQKASEGLKLLLAAWARYEDETPDGLRRDHIQGVRQDWGKYAKYFLRDQD